MRGQAAAPEEMAALDLQVWREFVARQCGHVFSESRVRILQEALQVRMKLHRTASNLDYYHRVAFHPDGPAEWQHLLELLLNKETSFYRHCPSYNALTTFVLPRLLHLRQGSEDAGLRLWSAGCSTGQEAYSLAMACLEVQGLSPHSVRVRGSDLSLRAIEQARRNRYKRFEIRRLPVTCADKYLEVIQEGTTAVYRVRDEASRLVEFEQFNLLEPGTYPAEPQDVIFCQNVLIYFPLASRGPIIAALSERLHPGGYLFLGPGEAGNACLPGMETISLPDAQVFRLGS